MPKIQVITYDTRNLKVQEIEQLYEMCFSNLESPKSLDMYDLNIIDFTQENLWKNTGKTQNSITTLADIENLSKMIDLSEKSQFLIVLPGDILMRYYWSRLDKKYLYSIELKNNLELLTKIVHKLTGVFRFTLVFENNTTQIQDTLFTSSFFFNNSGGQGDFFDFSESMKTVSISHDNFAITTLNILDDVNQLSKYLTHFFEDKNDSKVFPKWIEELNVFDDKENKENLIKNNEQIQKLEEINLTLEKDITKNNELKLILVENDDKLVDLVFPILEELFQYDLSDFVDNKNEDFLIELEDIDFVGEIKGVSKNIRQSNISQAETHLTKHKEKLEDEGIEKASKSLLIINHQRNKEIADRYAVEQDIIEFAEKRECLIISTYTLLLIYEIFLSDELNTDVFISVLKEKNGELFFNDFKSKNTEQ